MVFQISDIDRMSDATVRVERIIWIPGAIACLVTSGDFKDFIEDFKNDEKLQQELNLKFPHINGIPQDDTEWLIEEGFAECNGFFVQAATPIMKKIGTSSAMSYSWGKYHTKWFHIDNVENIANTISDWAYSERLVQSW